MSLLFPIKSIVPETGLKTSPITASNPEKVSYNLLLWKGFIINPLIAPRISLRMMLWLKNRLLRGTKPFILLVSCFLYIFFLFFSKSFSDFLLSTIIPLVRLKGCSYICITLLPNVAKNPLLEAIRIMNNK